MSERKAVIKNADMSEEMQQDAVDCATLKKYNIEKDIAAYINKDGTGRHLAVQVRLNESDVIVSVVADVIRVEYSQWLQISLPGDYTSTRQQWESWSFVKRRVMRRRIKFQAVGKGHRNFGLYVISKCID